MTCVPSCYGEVSPTNCGGCEEKCECLPRYIWNTTEGTVCIRESECPSELCFEFFNWGMHKSFLGSEKGSKSGNFQTNLVDFVVEKGLFVFVTHCYIWALAR